MDYEQGKFLLPDSREKHRLEAMKIKWKINSMGSKVFVNTKSISPPAEILGQSSHKSMGFKISFKWILKVRFKIGL